MSDSYYMPVKAIKNILAKELQGNYSDILQRAYNVPQKGMIHYANRALALELDACQTYEDLEDYLVSAGYGMTLQEWINSL